MALFTQRLEEHQSYLLSKVYQLIKWLKLLLKVINKEWQKRLVKVKKLELNPYFVE